MDQRSLEHTAISVGRNLVAVWAVQATLAPTLPIMSTSETIGEEPYLFAIAKSAWTETLVTPQTP